jgi:transcription initiation factor TFIIIB Brf1 subunit/transcription initiation factor TFIIB
MFVIIRCPDCHSLCMELDKENEMLHCNACGKDHDPDWMTLHFSQLDIPDGTAFIDHIALDEKEEKSE